MSRGSEPLPPHTCLGACYYIAVKCSCGWQSGTWGAAHRSSAYAEFRAHKKEHASEGRAKMTPERLRDLLVKGAQCRRARGGRRNRYWFFWPQGSGRGLKISNMVVTAALDAGLIEVKEHGPDDYLYPNGAA